MAHIGRMRGGPPAHPRGPPLWTRALGSGDHIQQVFARRFLLHKNLLLSIVKRHPAVAGGVAGPLH